MLSSIVSLVEVVVSFFQLVVVCGVVYYYFLLAAASLRRNQDQLARKDLPDRRFAVAIPAHNEADVLAKTLEQLHHQVYPRSCFEIYVVADYCTDNTAAVARENGATCYQREEGPRGRKAYALQWLLQRILSGGKEYDAILIFDADSQVDSGFMQAMNDALSDHRPVLQGQHVILNPQGSSFGALASVDMRINNLIRNQARDNLGLSCRLMGDGMCFDMEVIRQHGWPTDSLGEDREYGLYLLAQGVRVGYVPEAVSRGQAAPGWRAASPQRLRWYGGVFEIQRRFALKLLRLGLLKLDLAALDQAIELLLPSISTLAIFALLLMVIQIAWPALNVWTPLSLSIGAVVAWAFFPFLGLLVAQAPGTAYLALLRAPYYVVWRLWFALRARLFGKRVRWVRTRRSEEVKYETSE